MSIANLISLEGLAWARTPDGQLRELRIGDALQPGEFLVTGSGSRAVLDLMDSPETLAVGSGRVVELDALVLDSLSGADSDSPRDDQDLEELLAALEDPDADLLAVLDPAGAGPDAGGEGGGHDFVRLPRIVENVDPLNYDFDRAAGRELPETRDASAAVAAAVPGAPEDTPTVPADPGVPDPEDPVEPEDPDPEDPVAPEDPDPEDPVDPDPEDPVDPEDPDPEDPVDPEDPDPEDPVDPEDPDPEDPVDPEDPDPEDPVEPEDPDPVAYVTHAHTVGASNAGTMANANSLKSTGHQSAEVSRSDAGFYAVDHAAASDDPAAIEPGEAILFDLSAPVASASFELTGPIHGATYHLYDADGVRFFEGNLEGLEIDEGVIVIEHGSAFSYIAFLGGSTGPGQSGDGSAFALRPISLEPEISLIGDEPESELVSLEGDSLAGEAALESVDDSLTTYRLGEDGAIDLRDLLNEWEGGSDSLGDYLQASPTEGGDTLLHVSVEGGFVDGGLDVADQVFLLEGVAYHENILQQLLEDDALAIE